MRLSSGSQVNAREYAVHRKTQGRDIDLGKMHIYFVTAMGSSQRLPIDSRQVQRDGERRVYATLGRARIHQRGKLLPQ